MLPSYIVFASTSGRCGLSVHTIDWVRALAEAGHPVTLIVCAKDYFTPYLNDTPVRIIQLPLPENMPFYKTFRFWSKALKPYPAQRAVYPRGVGGSSSLSILAALRFRYPRLYTIEHAMANLPQIAWGKPEPRHTPVRTIRNVVASRLVSRSIAVSECTRQSVIQHYDFPANRIVTRHNWVDVKRFQPALAARTQLRSGIGVEEHDFLIGFVGRLVIEKRVDAILQGFAAFVSTSPRKAHLVLVGDGMLKVLRALATKLGVADKVHFVGMVNDTAPWMSAVDTLILASNSEAFALVGLEAMASGAILLAQPVGGLLEYVEHGKNGYLANLNTPEQFAAWWTTISKLQPEERELLQKNALRTAVIFRPAVKLAAFLEALDAPVAANFLREKEAKS
ncbi:glycosyltransferase family 4 protein [Sulfurirhabdus autotrophica]|uniref:Glycosyltransferase involved in cell wall biosynthesis n=1 Tax=Sulfurirhabdus autotrophica TaxID=1706046 RepID=A0A4R3Y8B5_9PROT|nr:glycosyltransferase family 4 protein [Sulfurirhabdus autotrophica]TCV88137.1 glycosyltransferase involved in cell wall biosynthesis [Sulfurirhabdus autotrophica]